MKFDREAMLVYAITDRTWLGEQTLYEQVKEALQGGVTCVQLREKDLDRKTFQKEAEEIKALCSTYEVPFIINNDVALAAEIDADGVHVGQGDLPVEEVRKGLGPNKIVGVSARTVTQALEAQKKGADYLGVGAVFPTSTKKDANAVSRETVKAICNAVTIPVVAIGGINKENIGKLKGTGVDGVAVISAIFASKEIETTCRQLRQCSKAMVER